ncbi:Y-family DNA polymerase [Dyadobacter pollutisoli]|uniref:DNA polymerase Y family protein n=1 Tax=Dyadobacter pollutisoli TaxID=2910158 RepID=A0A9E8SMJ7_9BACT|nr:DNA polymerase Y family protein [Dyadobacter pollutisoli]WAC14820.1 DNA polymerase Y family protein [Dyadobacter pollutisoli]
MKRYVAIWFRHLTTDQLILLRPELADVPFVLASPERGRMVVRAASIAAKTSGIDKGMVVADARAVLPGLQIIDDDAELAGKLLYNLAEWALRYTPIAAMDLPDGLLLDASGCCHLWGGEVAYLKDIVTRLRGFGYDVRAAMADTIGAAWAASRYALTDTIISPGDQVNAMQVFPPAALRIEAVILEKMQKLGFYQIKGFIHIPRSVLRRRFGQSLLDRLGQALGYVHENLEPIQPLQPYQERLPSLEPILTATGIELALKRLLEQLCTRLAKEGKGLRQASLKCYRVDGEMRQIEIGTSSPSCSTHHLFRLFELKIATIEPALGIELFLLEAPVVEDMTEQQETIWNIAGQNKWAAIAELLDRLAGRAGTDIIHRYLPSEHYWPERSIAEASSLREEPAIPWRTNRPRPIHLLRNPERVEVTVPMPDYPPMLFRYKGQIHKVRKADGPERIEQEWWISEGLLRDYYILEDETGARFWIFRLGHYNEESNPEWFVHGFFA